MRRLASFRKHVEGLDLEKQAKLLTCPKAAKEEIGKLLNQLQQQVCITLLWIFTCNPPALYRLSCSPAWHAVSTTWLVTFQGAHLGGLLGSLMSFVLRAR